MLRLSLNVLLTLIIQSKITGKGKTGNGRLLVKILQAIADSSGNEKTAEKNILSRFNNEQVKANAYHKIDMLIKRFLPDGKYYSYEKITFAEFERSIGDSVKCEEYYCRMRTVCDEIIDNSKIETLVYTLLEIIRQDDSIRDVLYGSSHIPKEQFFGSSAHPKQICFEALLIGLIYLTHKNPVEENTQDICLMKLPKKKIFRVIRFNDSSSLDLNLPLKLEDSLRENASVYETSEMKYRLEIYCGDTIISELPESGNIFLYGTGGAGKTTLLLNQINSDNSVNFYFSLYKYKREIHEKLQSESCWILLQILLKYQYQYEYQTYESCVACEGENTVLQQLAELKSLLKITPIDGFTKYTLLLDGINELPSELQEQLVEELKYIVNEWKNVRIMITGRTVPRYAVCENFQQLEICGVSDIERDKVLSEFSDISINTRLLELLKTPLFLNMYLESDGTELNTRGEILDSYVMNIQSRLPQDSAVRFAVQYALPFAAKMMTDGFSYEIDRGDLSESIDSAIEFYLKNERVYQNYIAPKKFRKRNLLECMGKMDFTEILIENICFLLVSSQEPHKLCFTHQYFRDYFAAKHILNIAEALSVSYEYKHTDERTELFKKYELDMMWFRDEDDIYRLIGEISGDYKNAPCEDFFYQRTILDSILDMSRDVSMLHTAECVMKSMSLVRGGVLCEVDFSRTNLPMYFPNNIKFSLDGKYPCLFKECWIFFLGLYDLPACCTTYSDDKKSLLIAFENGYVILWDDVQKRIIWDKDFSEFTEFGLEFEYANFDDDKSVITLVSCNSDLKVNAATGEIIGFKNLKELDIFDEYFDCIPKYQSTRTDLDNNLKLEIFSQLPHFRNCDFTGAEFFDDEGEKLLRIMGAVVDEM